MIIDNITGLNHGHVGLELSLNCITVLEMMLGSRYLVGIFATRGHLCANESARCKLYIHHQGAGTYHWELPRHIMKVGWASKVNISENR